MKNLLKIVPMLLMATCFIGCSDDEDEIVIPTIEVNYVTLHGDWMLQEWNGAELPEGTYMYITFDRSEKSFVIYQNFDSMYGRKITGTFELEKDYYKGDVITGKYDFEKGEWNNEYIITDMLESGSMVWSAGDDVSKYVRCDSIPSNIIDEATRPEF
ncbi:MAG: hypothetical protein E7071_00320 [Bacteroidales bacterium]|nr:hypothetical protein [Bacteroidales bacterium]